MDEAYIMRKEGQKIRKTPFTGYNFLKFAILGILLQSKKEGKEFLSSKEVLEKIYENLGYDKTKYRKHTRKELNATLLRLVKFKNKGGKVYLLKKKVRSKKNQIMNVYAISKNGEKLFKEMRDYGLKAPRKRYFRTMKKSHLGSVMMKQEAFFEED